MPVAEAPLLPALEHVQQRPLYRAPEEAYGVRWRIFRGQYLGEVPAMAQEPVLGVRQAEAHGQGASLRVVRLLVAPHGLDGHVQPRQVPGAHTGGEDAGVLQVPLPAGLAVLVEEREDEETEG
ncbi:hypothetical protein [Streptomyces sp. NPDC059533]|uniref:hypothetical protein n=1 Tax=unclassified Streptomyces TaxID=2593676 RepID=UPI00368463EF